MDKYLFIFTITPVQSFISQARKTRDLYAGSRLLSHLVETAMECLENAPKFEVKVISPNEEIKSKPNRFFAKLKVKEGEISDGNYSKAISELGKSIEEKVREKFESIGSEAISNLVSDEGFKKLYKSQIRNHLYIYWVCIPFAEDRYEEAYREIERTLGAVKSVVPFSQFPELGRKCSICGERNIVVYRLNDSEEKNGLKTRSDNLFEKLYVKPNEVLIFYSKKDVGNYPIKYCLKEKELKCIQKGEGLCAVCFTKRMWDPQSHQDNKKLSFPSTAEIASLDWVKDVKEIDSNYIEMYRKCVSNFDPQMFYEDNLTNEYLEKYDHKLRARYIKELASKLGISVQNDVCDIDILKKCLRHLYSLKKNGGKEVGKPCKYYALIMLDGDKMGRWLSGENLKGEKNRKNLESFHRAMSKCLGDFAGDVYETMGDDVDTNNEHKTRGKVVYAGGDDVLAFVNLKYLWDILEELNDKFRKIKDCVITCQNNEREESNCKYFEENGFGIEENADFTASCGIAIAHYKTPLSIVLQQARAMEKVAKDEGNRNAFAIALLKHSGEIHKTVHKWNFEDNEGNSIKTTFVIRDLIKTLQNDEEGFSPTFITNLEREFQKIKHIESGYLIDDITDVLEPELRRLLIRSSNVQHGAKEEAERWARRLICLYNSQLLSNVSEMKKMKKKMDNFVSLLNIIDFIVRRSR